MGQEYFMQSNITYVVVEESVSENIELIQNVFKALEKHHLDGVKYFVTKMGNNVFIHIAQFVTEADAKKFSQLDAFMQFRKSLVDKLSEDPINNEIEEIGFYASENIFSEIKNRLI